MIKDRSTKYKVDYSSNEIQQVKGFSNLIDILFIL